MRYGRVGLYSGLEAPQAEPVDASAYSTGYWELDEIWKLYPGQFTVVTGVAGHGKSTFCFNVLLNIASKERRGVFCFLPENEQHFRGTFRKIFTGTDEEFDYIMGQKMFFQFANPDVYNEDYDMEMKDIGWILDCAKFMIEKEKVEVIFIDPWNELDRGSQGKGELTTEYVNRALAYVKNFCRKYQVAVIMVAHPTKAVNENGGRDARLYDIEGSAAWKNKADNGLIVIRGDGNQVRVKSEKVRERGAGKVGTCYFTVDENGRFTPDPGGVIEGVEKRSVGGIRETSYGDRKDVRKEGVGDRSDSGGDREADGVPF